MGHYKTVSDIKWFKGGPKKCGIQTKMYRLYRKMTFKDYIEPFMVIFPYHLYIFVWILHGCLAEMVDALDPTKSVIRRL